MREAPALIAALVAIGLVVAIGLLSDSQHVLTLTIQTMILAALASSWNILGGFAGQISLGHGAFFGIGALITRELWLGGTSLGVSMAAAVAVTAVAAAIVGVPMLRFRDIYFAIGTLALGVAVFITAGNLWPGISSLPAEALRNYDFTGPYFVALGVLLVTFVVTLWLKYSKVGLGMMTVREDEEAARATGVNAFAHKMTSFVISAALAALAGGAFAYFSVSYFPNFAFSVIWTFEAILAVFIGGIGTIIGPLLGSIFLIVGRDLMPTDVGELQVVFFGVLFIVVVLLLPGGLTEAAARLVRRTARWETTTGPRETTATKGRNGDET
jgi:branched-chain amino acid transport system permease protein